MCSPNAEMSGPTHNVKGNGQQGFPVKLIESTTVPKLIQYLIKSRPLVSGSPAGYISITIGQFIILHRSRISFSSYMQFSNGTSDTIESISLIRKASISEDAMEG